MTALVILLAGAGLACWPPAPVAGRRAIWLLQQRGSLRLRRRGYRPPTGAAAGAACLAALALAGAVTLGPVPAGLAVAAGLVLRRCARTLSAERDAATEANELVGLVAALAAEHGAGAGLPEALAAAGSNCRRWKPVLLRAADRAGQGLDPAAELAAEPRLAGLAVVVALAERNGVALAPVLSRFRTDLGAAIAARRRLAEVLAGPRASAAMLAGLPALGLGLGAAAGIDPAHILLHTPAGLAALVAGVGLDLLGLLWTLKLTS